MYIVSVGEIFLKGKNRNVFERKLIRNIKLALDLKSNELQIYRNRYIITNEKNINKLQRVFGVYSYSKVEKCDIKDIKKTALNLITNQKTFRISSKKLPSLKKSSIQINEEVGEYVLDNKNIKVDLENPEINIRIEEIGNFFYLYTETIKGPGGLPTGSSGLVFLRVKDETKSTVAAYLMMKRGSKISLSKELPLIKKFEYGFKLKIRKEKEEDYVVLDETFENLDLKHENKFIMRPLLGYSKEQMHELYQKIKSI